MVVPMIRSAHAWVALVMALAVAAGGCGKAKDPEKKGAATADAAAGAATGEAKADKPAEPAPPAPITDPKALAEEFGVTPGGIERPKNEGSDAVLTSIDGKAQVRRVGEEQFAAAKAAQTLFAGDQVRTEADSSATITLLDETVIELAPDSVVALGNRDASADPASSAAVLMGAARFSVSPRVPGEGPFIVFTPGAIVTTKGTVYGVAVAASGEARVGVEVGEVAIAGLKALDTLVALSSGKSAEITVEGEVQAPVEFKADDWAEWRVAAEADADARTLAELHLEALGNLETQLDDAYADLSATTEAAANVDAQADAQLEAGDAKAYAAAAPEYGATIEASYLASLRLQQLTFATQSHALVAEELYLRHPDEVSVVYTPVQMRVQGAVLLNKKFHVFVAQRVRPLRVSYYAHHPEGRVHAVLVGQAVPDFYAKVKLRPVAIASVRAHVHGPVFVPPRVSVKANAKLDRKVVIATPDVGWHSHVSVKAAPVRAGAGWNAHGAAAVKGKLLVGVPTVTERVSVFGKLKVAPIAAVKLSVRGEPLVTHVHAHKEVAGGVSGGLEAGARLKGKGVRVVDHSAGAAGAAGAKVKGGVKAGVDVKVKVKVPRPPPPPKIKVEGGVKIKGGIKIGH
jgi:hypothetical protein